MEHLLGQLEDLLRVQLDQLLGVVDVIVGASVGLVGGVVDVIVEASVGFCVGAGGQQVDKVTAPLASVDPPLQQQMSAAVSKQSTDQRPPEQKRSNTRVPSHKREHSLSWPITVSPLTSIFSLVHLKTFPGSSATVPVNTRSAHPQPGVGLSDALVMAAPLLSFTFSGVAGPQIDFPDAESKIQEEETTMSD